MLYRKANWGLVSLGNVLFLIGDPTEHFRVLKRGGGLFTWSLLGITGPD